MIPKNELIEAGLKAADRRLPDQVKTWEFNTDEKANVARDLMIGVKALLRATTAENKIRTLSIGSSDEPQFKLLHALSDGGLWLYDRDEEALETLRARVYRMLLTDVHLEKGDYLEDFLSEEAAEKTLDTRFAGQRFDLITLHHMLYYCASEDWPGLVLSLCSRLLHAPGTMHIALMSSKTESAHTTTWLYNRFAQKFFGSRNSQDLLELPLRLREAGGAEDLRFATRSSSVRFRPTSFEDLMAVVWMILLYPHVHRFTLEQRVEITEFVLEEFWLSKRDLVQVQDYVTISKSP